VDVGVLGEGGSVKKCVHSGGYFMVVGSGGLETHGLLMYLEGRGEWGRRRGTWTWTRGDEGWEIFGKTRRNRGEGMHCCAKGRRDSLELYEDLSGIRVQHGG
jgi:hypothetical protein